MTMKQPQLHFYDMGSAVTAFSSKRKGGYSRGAFGEFNINPYCGDNETAIRQNRSALCQSLAIDDARLLMPHQVHETIVATVDEAFLSLTEEEQRQRLEGVDALMTNVPEVCIGVSTADCIPILLYDEEHSAVCAVHAGWRGTVMRIVEKAVRQMEVCYGTRPSALVAQIGPGIHRESFEVGDEVYDAFHQAGFPMEAISERREKWHIDLPVCNRLQLLGVGVKAPHIRVDDNCTYQQCDDFFSARRLGIQSGRIYTGIVLRKIGSTNKN